MATTTHPSPKLTTWWTPVNGILLCIAWAPMAVAIPRLPDLGSAAGVEAFWRDNMTLMRVVVASVSVGFLFFLGFLGGLVARLRAAHGPEPLVWMGLASSIMFMTALNVAIGLDVAGGLVLETSGARATYLLHTAGFVLAAPAALVGSAFFVAMAGIAFASGALPRWLGWLACVGVLANVGAIGGLFSLTGPLNSGNGALGGIAAPLGLYVLWILAASLTWLREASRGAPTPIVGDVDEPAAIDRVNATSYR